jgi:DNA-binding transcriptional LysR family regulator
MDVDALRTFLAVHRCGGVTRAAAELSRSQPALSRRLALLERELGAPLFERIPSGTALSQAGQALLPYAEAALAALHDGHAAVHAVHSGVSGPVSVALVGTLASTRLTAVLRHLTHQHPNLEVLLRTATSHEVSDLVRRGEVTLGLRYSDDPAPELRCETLFAERLLPVAAPDHPRANTRHAAPHGLAGQRWITFPTVPGRPEASAAYVRHALDAAGVPDEQILRIDSLTAQKRLVEAGFGIALLPESGIQEELATGSLTVLEVDDLDVRSPSPSSPAATATSAPAHKPSSTNSAPPPHRHLVDGSAGETMLILILAGVCPERGREPYVGR